MSIYHFSPALNRVATLGIGAVFTALGLAGCSDKAEDEIRSSLIQTEARQFVTIRPSVVSRMDQEATLVLKSGASRTTCENLRISDAYLRAGDQIRYAEISNAVASGKMTFADAKVKEAALRSETVRPFIQNQALLACGLSPEVG